MPLAGPLARDRALAHYKHASRYDKEGEAEKSIAHLRRALDYVSFGTKSGGRAKRRRSPSQLFPDSSIVDIANVIAPYDPALREYPESKGTGEYDPDYPEYTPRDTLGDAHAATLAAARLFRETEERRLKEEYDPDGPSYKFDPLDLPYDPANGKAHTPEDARSVAQPRKYYKMTNPPIHIQFVHPLVNAWFRDHDDDAWTNVYASVDEEADSYIAASGKTTYPIIMKELGTVEQKVRLANGKFAHCIPFDREFVHGVYCCVVVGARDNKPITVTTDGREEDIWGVECDERTTKVFLDKELKRRRDWGYERLYVLDIPAYRKATLANTSNTNLCVHVPDHPLVNLWVLNLYSSEATSGSGTLTNVYARDTNQLKSCATPADESTRILTSLMTEQPPIPIKLEHAYQFLKRANTQRTPVRILNKSALEDILSGPSPPEKDLHIKAIRAFLKTKVSPKSRKLVVPACFVSLQHAFKCNSGYLVTIKPIEPNHRVDDPENRGYTMRPESFSLLGVWGRDEHGKGVTVLTTEADYVAAYHQEKANQQNARDRDSSRKLGAP